MNNIELIINIKAMTFSPSLSQIPTEKQILRHLKKIIFGKKVVCPDCGRQCHVQEIEKNRLWRCKKCRNKFSITSVTWLKGMKITLKHLWCLVWCWQRKTNVLLASELLNLSVPTVRRYYALFRDNLKLNEDIILSDKVQMDEMFVREAFVIGAKDVRNKKIKLRVVNKKAPDKKDAMEMIFDHVRPGSTLCTDGGGIYRGCDNWWPLKHKKDIHSKFEFGITSEIEGVWANLRTFIRRMYHHVTREKLSNVVAEFEARFSRPDLFDSPLNYFKNSLSSVKFAL